MKIVENFAELFVNTEPQGADVYINGRLRGTSPLLIEKVPIGKVVVSGQFENMQGSVEKEIKEAGLSEVNIKLEVTYGRIFIKTSDSDVDVIIDGKNMGRYSDGLYKDVPAGVHELELKGDGLYWQQKIFIDQDKTLNVEAYPRDYGVLIYKLPDGAAAVLKSSTYETELSGRGAIDIPADSYTITASLENHETIDERISLKRSETARFEPEMVYTSEYLTAEASAKYSKRWEEHLAWKKANESLYRAQFDRFSLFYKEITESGFDIPSLITEVKAETLEAGKNRLDELDALLEGSGEADPLSEVVFWSSVGAAAVGLVGGNLVYWLLREPEREYYEDSVTGANTTEKAVASHQLLELYDILSFSLWGVGAVGTVAAIVSSSGDIFVGAWEAEKKDLSGKMSEIRGGL